MIINEEGTFEENWRDVLPDDIRDEPSIQSFKTIQGLAKTAVEQAKLIGKKGLIKPSPEAEPSEWEKFYNELGRPESPDQYKVSEGVQASDELRKTAHEIGLTAEQFQKLAEWDSRASETIKAELEQAQQEASQKKEDALRALWGTRYDERMGKLQSVAQQLDESGTIKDNPEMLKDPAIANVLSKLMDQVSEDSLPLKEDAGMDGTLGSVEKRINEILSDRDYMGQNPNRIRQRMLFGEIQSLYQRRDQLRKSMPQ